MIATMDKEDFESFRQRVLQDVSLQEKLRGVTGRRELINMTVRLGAELGYSFTEEDVESALRESRRVWMEKWI
ncbi:MAG TPA: Nif11-like leader peptide family natural product precursor [Pyrinomonadaceae bacterium]|nr:Nif11-like leader peptide family natural product precursor [Pyrinomonadaceae bacterium]